MTINVKEIINSEIACDIDNALKIKQLIIKGLDDGEFPTIDFTGIDILTPSFINLSICDLYEYYNADIIDCLEFKGTAKHKNLIKILMEEAKEYWSKKNMENDNMEIKTHEQLLKMHGKRITCGINGRYIDDARISVENEFVYACQNEENGDLCKEKFDYKYSWNISGPYSHYEEYKHNCFNIKLVEEQDLDKVIDDITPSNEYKQKQFKMHLNDVLKSIECMLLEKNRMYGNSALEPIRVFSKADKVEQLKVRIDDKINRLKNQQSDDIEDSVNDLIGYLLLLKIANKEI